MPNNIPIGNMDFASEVEATNALQRNWQLGQVQYNFASGAGLTTNFTASTIYGVVAQSGTVTITAGSSSRVYGFSAPVAFYAQMGLPTLFLPPGGACNFTVNTSTAVVAIVYK